MNNPVMSILAFFAIALTASAASEEIINRQLAAAPGGKLVVDVAFGSLNVTAGADDKVVLEAHREIDFHDEAKEKEYLASVPITFTQEGNVVTVRSRGKFSNDWNIGHRHNDARYNIRVPKKFELALRTDGGSVDVSDVSGNLKAHTSGGTMTFARLEGTLDAETSGGFIQLEACKGKIDIETSGGHIKVAQGEGTLNARTSGGHIEVRNFSGDTEVRTSGGRLDLERVSGKLIGKTSGGAIRALMPGALIGDIKLQTSAGNIDLAIPANSAVSIDANTNAGEVVSRLPLQVTDVRREHLRGMLNGGGKSVLLETSAGTITIKASSQEVANR